MSHAGLNVTCEINGSDSIKKQFGTGARAAKTNLRREVKIEARRRSSATQPTKLYDSAELRRRSTRFISKLVDSAQAIYHHLQAFRSKSNIIYQVVEARRKNRPALNKQPAVRLAISPASNKKRADGIKVDENVRRALSILLCLLLPLMSLSHRRIHGDEAIR